MGQGPTDLDTLIALTARIEAARADDPALAACEPGELLRHVPGKRALLRCRLGDRAAIMRLGLAPGGSPSAPAPRGRGRSVFLHLPAWPAPVGRVMLRTSLHSN